MRQLLLPLLALGLSGPMLAQSTIRVPQNSQATSSAFGGDPSDLGSYGDLVVTSFATDSVFRYDGETGDFIGIFASGHGLDGPDGVTIGPDANLYVSGSVANNVFRFDGETGEFIDVFTEGGNLNSPTDLTFGPDGHLYVSGFSSGAVLRYDGQTGQFIDVFACLISGLGGPIGLVFGPGGHLYVSQAQEDRVLRYDGQTGDFIDVFVSGPELDNPHGLTFGPDESLYIIGSNTDQVLRYDGETGEFLDVFVSSNDLDRPRGLLFGPDGNLYVTCTFNDNVARFDGQTGDFIDVFASGGGVNSPSFLAFLPDSGTTTGKLDIRPGSCPNSLNRNSNGVLPIALVGILELDVTLVDLSTLQLARADRVGGGVAPLDGPPGPHPVFEDVATPFEGQLCDCHAREDDGVVDLLMKFKTQELVDALELGSFVGGSEVELVLTGAFLDGTAFSAADCVLVVPPAESVNLDVQTNADEAFMEVWPADLALDSDDFTSFARSYFPGTVDVVAAFYESLRDHYYRE